MAIKFNIGKMGTQQNNNIQWSATKDKMGNTNALSILNAKSVWSTLDF